jgi:hypothetical protein
MIIQQSQINLSSQHQLVRQEEEHERLKLWHDGATREAAEQAAQKLSFKSDRVSLSIEAGNAAKIGETSPVVENSQAAEIPDSQDLEDDPKNGWKLNLLRRLVEQLTGHKIKVVRASDLHRVEESGTVPPDQPLAEQSAAAESENLGWGLSYQYQHLTQEAEQTSFKASGVVKTADGREIDLSVQLNMSRSFSSYESIDIRAGDALKDPLVVNYAGTAAELGSTELQFDIDLDGQPDPFKFVAPGSGYLALDKNSDGVINDGGELFGPATGQGFAELAAYDQDANNWIDENDDIYSRLRIWTRDAENNSQLLALGQKGIGAIYLDQVATPFSLNDSQNKQQGQIQSSGIFLYESGLAGTIQQLDLVV